MVKVKRTPAPVPRVLEVLKKYRGKSSLMFLVKWVIIKRPQPDMKKVAIPIGAVLLL